MSPISKTQETQSQSNHNDDKQKMLQRYRELVAGKTASTAKPTEKGGEEEKNKLLQEKPKDPNPSAIVHLPPPPQRVTSHYKNGEPKHNALWTRMKSQQQQQQQQQQPQHQVRFANQEEEVAGTNTNNNDYSDESSDNDMKNCCIENSTAHNIMLHGSPPHHQLNNEEEEQWRKATEDVIANGQSVAWNMNEGEETAAGYLSTSSPPKRDTSSSLLLGNSLDASLKDEFLQFSSPHQMNNTSTTTMPSPILKEEPKTPHILRREWQNDMHDDNEDVHSHDNRINVELLQESMIQSETSSTTETPSRRTTKGSSNKYDDSSSSFMGKVSLPDISSYTHPDDHSTPPRGTRRVRHTTEEEDDQLLQTSRMESSPLSTMRRNTMHQVIQESNVYIHKIEELQSELQKSQTEAIREAEIRMQCVKRMEDLQHQVDQMVESQKSGGGRGLLTLNTTTINNRDMILAAADEEEDGAHTKQSLIERNKTLVKEVRFADQTCVELSGKNVALTKEKEMVDKENAMLKTENASLQDQLLQSNRKEAKLETLNESLAKQVQEQQQQQQKSLATLQSQLCGEQQSHKELLKDMNLQEKEFSKKEKQLHKQFQKQIQNLNSQLEKVTEERSILKIELSLSKETQKNRTGGDNDGDGDDDTNKKEKQNDEQEKAKKEMEDIVESIKRQHGETLDKAQSEIEQLKKLNDQINQELQNERELKDNTSQELQEERMEKDKIHQELQSERDLKEATAKELHAERESKDKINLELQNEAESKKALEIQCAELRGESHNLKGQLEAETKFILKQRDELIAESAKLKMQLETLSEEFSVVSSRDGQHSPPASPSRRVPPPPPPPPPPRLQQKISELEEKLSETQSQLDSKLELEQRLSEMQALLESKTGLEDELVKAQKSLESNADLEQKLSETNVLLESKSEELQQLREQLASNNTQVRKIQSENRILLQRVEHVVKENDQLSSERSQVSKAEEEKLAFINRELTKALQEKTTLSTKLFESSTTIRNLELQLDALKQKCDFHKHLAESAKGQLETMKKTFAQSQKDVKSAETDIMQQEVFTMTQRAFNKMEQQAWDLQEKVDEKFKNYATRLAKMANTVRFLQDSLEVKSQSDSFSRSKVSSQPNMEQLFSSHISATSSTKQEITPTPLDNDDDVMNATFTVEQFRDEHFEMMEEARPAESASAGPAREASLTGTEELLGITFIDSVSNIHDDDLSSLGSVNMQTNAIPRSVSQPPPANLGTTLELTEAEHSSNSGDLDPLTDNDMLAQQHNKTDERKSLLEQLRLAQVEIQELRDTKLNEQETMKISMDNQKALIEGLESKTSRLSAEKMDVESRLLTLQRENEKQIRDMQAQLDELQGETTTQISCMETIKENLTAKDEVVAKLQKEQKLLKQESNSKIKSLESQVSALSLEKDEVEGNLLFLRQDYDTKQKELETALTDVNNARNEAASKMDTLQSELEKQVTESASMEQERNELRQKLESTVTSLAEATLKSGSLKANLEDSTQKQDETSRITEELREKVDLKQQELDRSQKRCEELISQVDRLMTSEVNLSSEVVCLQVSVNEAKAEVETLIASNLTANEKAADLSEQNAQKDDELREFKTALHKAEMTAEKASSEAHSAELKLSEMHLMTAELNAEIESLKEDYNTSSSEARTAELKLSEMRTTTLSLKTEISALKEDLAAVRSGIAEKNNIIESLHHSDRQSKEKLDKLQEDLRDAEESILEKSEQVKILVKERERVHEELKQELAKSQTFAEKTSKIEFLEYELKCVESVNAELKENCAQSNANYTEKERRVEFLEEEAESLKKTNQGLAQECSQLQTSIAQKNTQIESFEDKCNSLMETNKELQQECSQSQEFSMERKNRIEALEHEEENLTEKLLLLETSLADANRDGNGLKKQLLEVEKNVDISKREHATEIEMFQLRFEEKDIELETSLEKCKGLALEIEQLQVAAQEANSELDGLKVSYVACNDKLAHVSEQNANNEALVAQFKDAHEAALDMVSNAEKQLSESQMQVKELREHRMGLEKRLAKVEEVLCSTQNEFDSYKGCIEENQIFFEENQRCLEEDLAAKEDMIATLENKCSRIQRKLGENMSSFTVEQETLLEEASVERQRADHLQEQLFNAKKDLGATTVNLREVQDELAEARQDIYDAKEHAKSKASQLEESGAILRSLRKKLKESSRQITQLDTKLVDVEATLEMKNEETDKYITKNASLERKNMKLRDYIHKLTTKCEEWSVSYEKQARLLENVQNDRWHPRT